MNKNNASTLKLKKLYKNAATEQSNYFVKFLILAEI